MAAFVYKDARLEVNSVNLSDHVRQVTLQYEADEQDKTAMGDNSKKRLAGLKNWQITVEFNQDFAAANVDATLFSLVGAAAFPIKLRPTTSAISATNPEYQGNAILTSYQPLGGSVGDIAVAPITLMGDGDLTRATA